MRMIKTIMAFLTAMTMTMGAVGVTVQAVTPSFPVDVNEEFEGIRGDMDGDGQITMHDANLIARYLRENAAEKLTAKADYSSDGYVNVRDAALMAKDIQSDSASADNTDYSSSTYYYPVVVNEEFEGIRGDMDGDGKITVRDVTTLCRFIVKDDYKNITAKADYNMDGYVNVRDAALIAKELRSGNASADDTTGYAEDDYSIEAIISRISHNFDDPAVEYKLPSREYEGIKGDINNDGTINTRDAAVLCKFLVKGEYESITAQGDMDDNGAVNIIDVALIQKHILDNADDKDSVAGDMNGDGEVTLRDSFIMAKMLSDPESFDLEKWLAKADYNGDGEFDIRDPAAVQRDVVLSGVLGEGYKTTSDIVIVTGDADLNNEVDLADLTVISKYSLNSTAFPFANEVAYVNADINGDDKIDSLDITALIEQQINGSHVSE